MRVYVTSAALVPSQANRSRWTERERGKQEACSEFPRVQRRDDETLIDTRRRQLAAELTDACARAREGT